MHMHGMAQGSRRSLIKAVIYDMASFIQKTPTNTKPKALTNAEMSSAHAVVSGRDWSNVINVDIATHNPTEATTVTASEVMQRLGVENVPGLHDRVVMPKHSRNNKSRLEEKQMLEEMMGRGDSVRAKYMEKIRAKKMMAEARRERERFTINSGYACAPQLSPPHKPWHVTPGSPALVRYLEERGISQALIARGDQSQLNDLVEELQNYKFQHVRTLEIAETEKSTTEVTKASDHYNEIMKTFCAIWSLPPWQVLLVIGDDAQDEALHKTILGSQFFVCKVKSLSYPEEVNSDQNNLLSHAGYSKKSDSNLGLVSWFKRLSEGTLCEEDVREGSDHNSKDVVHFKVTDMTEVKWIIEDMNGVSYRTSTFVQGFQ